MCVAVADDGCNDGRGGSARSLWERIVRTAREYRPTVRRRSEIYWNWSRE